MTCRSYKSRRTRSLRSVTVGLGQRGRKLCRQLFIWKILGGVHGVVDMQLAKQYSNQHGNGP